MNYSIYLHYFVNKQDDQALRTLLEDGEFGIVLQHQCMVLFTAVPTASSIIIFISLISHCCK